MKSHLLRLVLSSKNIFFKGTVRRTESGLKLYGLNSQRAMGTAASDVWDAMDGNELRVYNTFTKRKEKVFVGQKPVSVGSSDKDQLPRGAEGRGLVGTCYCCGPTVYEDSHLGHALTYTRFDLFRRVLHYYCDVDLLVGMGITDIDDKILAKANASSSSFRSVGEMYSASFLQDMNALGISPPHFYLRVTDHIQDIVHYIQRLEQLGYAYVNPQNQDVTFDSGKVAAYTGTEDQVTEMSTGKKSPRDFVLWKRAKDGEPFWDYKSVTSGQSLPGRPGWHVECSAMASGVFGSQLDFHFGGKDLIFPHHYNEAACCHAFYGLQEEIYGWSNFWLHSGHLVFQKEKMSKSLGNIISIKNFLKTHSANILRLFCLKVHYRSDVIYEENMLEEAKSQDSRLQQFAFMLKQRIAKLSSGQLLSDSPPSDSSLSSAINETEVQIMAGIADDLNLNRGFSAILKLHKHLQTSENSTLLELVRINIIFEKWLNAMGLEYEVSYSLSRGSSKSPKEETAIALVTELRIQLRALAIQQKQLETDANNSHDRFNISNSLLKICDQLRNDLKSHGVIVEDAASKQMTRNSQ